MKHSFKTTLNLFVILLGMAAAAQAQEDAAMRPERGARPPRHEKMMERLKAQLSEDQWAELQAAATMEERRDLLESWGIKPPARPDHRGEKPRARPAPPSAGYGGGYGRSSSGSGQQ